MSDLEGAMLSDYLLQKCINKGGIADVYRARQIMNEPGIAGETMPSFEVAIKIFRSAYAQRAAFRDYFMAEAEKIGQFDHPNILPFLEYGEGESLLYLVTPFIETGTLEYLLQQVGGRFSALQALPIVEQVCSAVQYAHERGIAHGNIKPSNVFVAADGRMLLTDFGIAHGFDDSQQSLTRVGWGSAEYAAPEQSLGVLRPTSDIYSLGVLFFRVLTGSPPFRGQTPVEVLLKHVRQSPPSARSFNPHISEAIDAVLAKAMQKRSDERFTSAEEFACAYAEAVRVAPVASPIARAVTTTKLGLLSPLQNAPVMEPQTPPPALYSNDSGNPQTPVLNLDRADAWTASTTDTPLPAASTSSPTSNSEATAAVLAKNELEYERAASTPLIWSVDPVEWSPLAKSEKTLPGVPMAAGDYLDEKRTVLEMAASIQTAQTVPTESGEQTTLQARLRKWLPFIVVALLLMGLLGAILSAFFYPV